MSLEWGNLRGCEPAQRTLTNLFRSRGGLPAHVLGPPGRAAIRVLSWNGSTARLELGFRWTRVQGPRTRQTCILCSGRSASSLRCWYRDRSLPIHDLADLGRIWGAAACAPLRHVAVEQRHSAGRSAYTTQCPCPAGAKLVSMHRFSSEGLGILASVLCRLR